MATVVAGSKMAGSATVFLNGIPPLVVSATTYRTCPRLFSNMWKEAADNTTIFVTFDGLAVVPISYHVLFPRFPGFLS